MNSMFLAQRSASVANQTASAAAPALEPALLMAARRILPVRLWAKAVRLPTGALPRLAPKRMAVLSALSSAPRSSRFSGC